MAIIPGFKTAEGLNMTTSSEPKGRSGPTLTTLKVVLVLAAVVITGLLVLMIIGLVVGPRQNPSPERILAECTTSPHSRTRKRYGKFG